MVNKGFTFRLGENILVLDGAMGTMLQRLGMKTNLCPEIYNLQEAETIENIHREYIEAGCNIIQTNSFGANRVKLSQYGLGDKVGEINEQAVAIARRASNKKVFIGGNIGPTGKLIYPLGDLTFDKAYDVFHQQARYLIEAGADLIIIETMSDIQEAKAAVMAVKDIGQIPIVCTMTFQENMRTLTGSDPEAVATILEALGVDVIGTNCGFGPDMMINIIRRMHRVTDSYLIAQPNAGLPKLINGSPVFDLPAERMADYMDDLVSAGVNIVGGCCGTSPQHIKLIVDKIKGLRPVAKNKINFSKLASPKNMVIIGDKTPTRLVGGYINPTGKQDLIDAIRNEKLDILREAALKQETAGAKIININLGIDRQDESKIFKKVVSDLQSSLNMPLALDTVNYNAMEEGLKVYGGKALLNSTNGEDAILNKVVNLAKRYGAAIVGLTLDEKGIPDRAQGRLLIAEKIVRTAIDMGMRKEDIFIDPLVLTVGAQQELALECIKAIRLIKEELGVRILMGVENISHGLPNRGIINNTFLAMALEAGLDMPILNPYFNSSWDTIKSADLLLGRDKNARNYLQWNQKRANRPKPSKTTEKITIDRNNLREKLTETIKQGDKSNIVHLLKKLMDKQLSAMDIINQSIIPALEIVGDNYDKGIYFLPQLLLAAEAAKEAFEYLKAYMEEGYKESTATIVIATVKGDIHDIGKNIVAIMLENHGFRVIDLGKDVEADVIIERALTEKADIIGLSALMTTTMMEMKNVKEKLNLRNVDIPILIGGAVVTQDFARDIGAYYAADAVGAIKIANEIISKRQV